MHCSPSVRPAQNHVLHGATSHLHPHPCRLWGYVLAAHSDTTGCWYCHPNIDEMKMLFPTKIPREKGEYAAFAMPYRDSSTLKDVQAIHIVPYLLLATGCFPSRLMPIPLQIFNHLYIFVIFHWPVGKTFSTLSLFICHHPICLCAPHYAREASFLQAPHYPAYDAATGLTIGVADIVEEPPTSLVDTMEFMIESAGEELTSQFHGRGIMHDAAKALVGKGWHHFVGIAHHLRDFGIGEESPRPGIQLRYGLHARIKLDGGHALSGSGSQDGRIAQARRRVEHGPAHRGERRDHALRVLPGIKLFDAIHH